MDIWSSFFAPDSRLVGLDIDVRVLDLVTQENVELYVADATDGSALDRVLNDSKFDIIVDDGSHHSSDINASFIELFPRLNPGGKYFIEDLHCSYWDAYGGGLRRTDSAIERLKVLIDLVNADHVTEQTMSDEFGGLVPLLRENIARVSFYDSLAVVERLPFTKTSRRAWT